jgi:hypothetical protein
METKQTESQKEKKEAQILFWSMVNHMPESCFPDGKIFTIPYQGDPYPTGILSLDQIEWPRK